MIGSVLAAVLTFLASGGSVVSVPRGPRCGVLLPTAAGAGAAEDGGFGCAPLEGRCSNIPETQYGAVMYDHCCAMFANHQMRN